MTAFAPEFDQHKFDELVLYISERNLDNPHFGKTKLHKQLWMSDFRHFGFTGQAITGARYIHKKHGPFCDQLDATIARLEDLRRLVIRPRELFGYVQQRPIALERSDLTHFSAIEIASVEDVLWETHGMSALRLSEYSHRHPGWLYTKEGEEISYGFASVPADELPGDERSAAAGS